MKRYEIRCTEEQTRKALELGAPIEHARVIDTIEGKSIRIPEDTGDFYICPNAEQMIYWLRTKGFRFKICEYERTTSWITINNNWLNHGECECHQKATLAAIDAALEYLISKKK